MTQDKFATKLATLSGWGMAQTPDKLAEALATLHDARYFVQLARDTARARHADYGGEYTDVELLDAIRAREALLARIDRLIGPRD